MNISEKIRERFNIVCKICKSTRVEVDFCEGEHDNGGYLEIKCNNYNTEFSSFYHLE